MIVEVSKEQVERFRSANIDGLVVLDRATGKLTRKKGFDIDVLAEIFGLEKAQEIVSAGGCSLKVVE